MSLGRELIYSTIEAEAAQTNGVERENNNGQPLTDYHSMCAIVYIRFIYFYPVRSTFFAAFKIHLYRETNRCYSQWHFLYVSTCKNGKLK